MVDFAKEVLSVNLEDEMRQSYLDYAMSVIVGRALNDAAMVGLAEKLKLDMDAFNKCIESDYPEEQVKRGQAEGARLGVDSTPTLFLNGRRLHLHDLEADLPGEITKALAAAK